MCCVPVLGDFLLRGLFVFLVRARGLREPSGRRRFPCRSSFGARARLLSRSLPLVSFPLGIPQVHAAVSVFVGRFFGRFWF
jgi:hypothetical protein